MLHLLKDRTLELPRYYRYGTAALHKVFSIR